MHLNHPSRTLLILVLLCVASLSAVAQKYRVDLWTTEQGLPQNSVNDLIQTQDGYLWTVTFGGLSRFDGISFTTVHDSLFPTNRFLCLAEGPDSTLWIGSEGGGLISLGPTHRRVYDARDGLTDETISNVACDRDGRIWISHRGGIQRLENGTVSPILLAGGRKGYWEARFRFDHAGDLWISANIGIYHVVRDSIVRVTAFDGSMDPPPFLAGPDSSGVFWASVRGAMAQFQGGRFVARVPGEWRGEDRINAMLVGDAGEFVVASSRTGISIYDTPSKPRRIQRMALPGGKTDFNVRSSYRDREGNFWFGTDGEGLVRVRRQTFSTISAVDGLTNEIVEAVMEDRNGNLWIGTNCGGLFRRAPGGKMEWFSTRKGIGHDCIWSLAQTGDGTIWAGSYGGGLFRLQRGRFVPFGAAQGFTQPVIFALAEDLSGQLWIGTELGGVSVLRGSTLTTYTTAQGLVHNNVRQIYEASDGSIWIGTLGGVSRYLNGQFHNYTTANGLTNNYVRALFEEPDGTIWIGTYGGGLNRFRNGQFSSVTTEQGLFDNVVSAIIADGRGNLWMSCNRGIYVASLARLNAVADRREAGMTCRAYGTDDGLLSNEANGGFQPSAWRTRTGDLLFPTIKGVAVLRPQQVPVHHDPPSVHITQVSINGRAVPLEPVIRLPYDRYRVEIEFTATKLIDVQHTQFRFQMQNVDNAWVEGRSRRIAYYPGIGSGDYQFNVMAASEDGTWSIHPASVRIVVETPYWQQWWFPVVMGMGFLGIVHLLLVRRRHVLEAGRKEEESYHQLIAESEKRYHSLFDETTDAIILTAIDGTILDINPSAMEMFEIKSKDEIATVGGGRLLFPSSSDRDVLIDRLKASGFLRDQELRLRRQNGEMFVALASLSGVFEDGVLTGIRGILHDITEKKRTEDALRRSEDLYRSLVENIKEVFFNSDAQGRITFGSIQFFAVTGYAPHEIIGRSFHRLVAPEDRRRVINYYRDCVEYGTIDAEIVFLALRKDGTTVWVEQNSRIIRDPSGAVREFRNVVRDITKRKVAEDRSAAFSRLGLELSSASKPEEAGAIIATVANNLLGWDGCTLDLFADERKGFVRVLNVETLRGRHQHVPPANPHPIPAGALRWVHRNNVPALLGSLEAAQILADEQHPQQRAVGSLLMVPIRHLERAIGVLTIRSSRNDAYGEPDVEVLQALADHAVGSLERIRIENAQQKLFDDVRVAGERLQALSQRLLSVQEDERRAIARELHDEIGQALTAVKINLQAAERSLGAAMVNPPLSESVRIVERALSQVRSLSLDLRPSILDDLGLVPAMRWFIDRQLQRGQFTIQMQLEELYERLSPDLEIVCFRVMQEAFNNIAKHANASAVTVRLMVEGKHVYLTIIDDGKGFNVEHERMRASHGHSLGLLGMEERVLLAGGTFHIESTPDRGTVIRALFPLHYAEPMTDDLDVTL